MSIELVDGQVVFKFDLGSGVAEIKSPDPYNNGQWHMVQANRLKQNGLLKIDSVSGNATTHIWHFWNTENILYHVLIGIFSFKLMYHKLFI